MDKSDLKIEDMVFSNKWIGTRIRNILLKEEITTLGQLSQWSSKDLLSLNHFGAICLAELSVKLDGMGVRLKDPSW